MSFNQTFYLYYSLAKKDRFSSALVYPLNPAVTDRCTGQVTPWNVHFKLCFFTLLIWKQSGIYDDPCYSGPWESSFRNTYKALSTNGTLTLSTCYCPLDKRHFSKIDTVLLRQLNHILRQDYRNKYLLFIPLVL